MEKMIEDILEGSKYTDLIAGFDMVNEEDFTPPIIEFVEEILKGKTLDKKFELPCYFHSGETNDRNNENVYDAFLLDSKRIAHGIQLSIRPHLIEMIKKKNISIEACPLSNRILGYVNDLRNHPMRYLLC